MSAVTSQPPEKILLVAIDFPPVSGGISVFIYNLWRHFPKDEIVVLAAFHNEGPDFDEKQNLRVYRTKKARANSVGGKILTILDLMFATRNIIKKENVRELHCLHLVSLGIIGYLYKLFKGIEYYTYVFGAEFSTHNKSKWLQKIILNKAKGIIVISGFSLKRLLRTGIQNRNIIKIIPGVDSEKFFPKLNNRKFIDKHNLNGKKVILTVARLASNKGCDIGIKVLPLVLKKVPNTVYVIGGKGPNETELKELASKMNLDDKVIFTGYIPDEELPFYYNLCDVFMLLTREIKNKGNVEGFGMVFIEAAACGKPVVAGRTGGAPEAVVDSTTGYLVDPLDLEEISEALIKLLTDEGLAMKMAQEGRRRAREEFRWQERAKELWEAIGA